MSSGKSDNQVFKEGLQLARSFYYLMGCEVRDGYRFDLAKHPQERLCWALAVEAYAHIAQTDLQSAADSEGYL